MSGYVRVRIDPVIRDEAAIALAAMGYSVSTVVRMLLTRIAKEKVLPFNLVPNAITVASMQEAQAFIDNQKVGRPLEEIFNQLEGQ